MANDLNPYIGLRDFKRGEGDIFFGRDEQIDQLISLLKKWHFLAVVGDSGCGKSSLVRAGLLYSLEQGFYEGYQWKIVKSRLTFPESEPFTNLHNALKKSGLDLGGFSEETLKRPEAIHEILYDNPLPEKTHLLIFIDQFEELFRYCREQENDKETVQFIDLLLNCCQHRNVHVVITMRADFLGECARFRGLVEAVTAGGFIVPHLTQKQLRDAIESPAKSFHGETDKKLVDRLIKDMGSNPNQLPLLQYALMYLWEQTTHVKKVENAAIKKLTEDTYNHIIQSEATSVEQSKKLQNRQTTWCHLLQHPWVYPWVPQRVLRYFNCLVIPEEKHKEQSNLEIILSHGANRIYRGLQSKKQQTIAEIVFRNLVDRNKRERTNTKRMVALKEIVEQVEAYFPDLTREDIEKTVFQVVNTFRKDGRNFIMPSSYKIPNGELKLDTKITITHESLINGWNLLREWVEIREQELVHQYKNIRYKAVNWDNAKKPIISLARGVELKNWYDWWKREKLSKAWAKRYDRDEGEKFKLTEEFLNASHFYEHLRLIEIWVVVFCAFFGLASLYFLYQQSQSESLRANEAQLAQSVSDSFRENYQEARKSLSKALDSSTTMPISYQHATNLLMGLNNIFGGEAQKTENFNVPLNALATNPAGTLFGVVGEQGTVVLLDMQQNTRKSLSGHIGIVRAVAIEPQGQWMVTSGDDKRVIRWSLPQGEQIGSWNASSEVWAVTISPDGKYIATGGKDNKITLWTETGEEIKPPFSGHSAEISALAFDKTGEYLASASYDNTVRIWQVKNGSYQELLGHTDEVQKLAFSPNGRLLATAGSDRTIRLWDTEFVQGEKESLQNVKPKQQAKKILIGHQGIVFGVGFTADGRYLASSSFDRTVRLWDVKSGVAVRTLQGHTAMVTNLIVKGDQIITVSADHSVKWWDATLPRQYHIDLSRSAISTAIAPNGQSVAVGFKDGAVCLYQLPSTKLLWESAQEKHGKAVRRLAWSSDGQWLASAGSDFAVKLWHATDDKLKLEQTLQAHQNKIGAVAFSPDNQFLVSVGYDGQIGVLKLGATAFEPKNYLSKKLELNSVAFNADGTKLLVSSDNTVYLFNFDKQTGNLSLSKSFSEMDRGTTIMWAALSSDGKRYASVGRDGIAKVYSTEDSKKLENVLTGHQTTILRAAFSPDNRQLVTVSGDATVRFWDLNGNRELFTLNLPTNSGMPEPLWDFDFRCVEEGECWIAIPLMSGKLSLYDLGKIYQ